MDDNTIILMLGVSLFLGGLSLAAFLWGIKDNQFDDYERNMNSVMFDSVDDLNDAIKRENKQKAYKEKATDEAS